MATDSTVPGAIATIAGYFTAIAADLPALSLGTYTGLPVDSVSDNYLMLGAWDTGQDLIQDYQSTWEALPAASQWIGEEYSVQGSLRTYAGDSDLSSRISDAFTLYNALRQQIVLDPGGSDTLSPSGSWGMVHVTMPANGPINGQGWGVILAFTIGVINVRLT